MENEILTKDKFIDRAIDDIINNSDIESQSLMLMEECAELIQSTSKLLRVGKKNIPTELQFEVYTNDKEKDIAIDHMCEEIADVEIVIEEMKRLLNINPEVIENIKLYKLKRQYKRMGLEVPEFA